MISTGDFGYVLLITGSIGLILVLSLLIRRRPGSYYFFTANLFIVAFSALLLSAIKTKWLIYFPHLFLTPSPLHYLIGPCCYFFTRFSLNPYSKFRWIDCFHLLPFILHSTELMPFFLKSTAEKHELLEYAYAGQIMMLDQFTTYLSYFQHIFIKSSFIFAYALTSYLMITESYRRVMNSYRQHNLLIYKWVTVETCLKMTLGISGIIRAIWNEGYPGVDLFFSIVLGLDTIIGFGFILLNPKILGGTNPVDFLQGPGLKTKTTDEIEEEPEPEGPFGTEEEAGKNRRKPAKSSIELFKFIESYFQSQKPFLQEDFSKELMIEKTGMTGKKISDTIRQSTGLNFSEYVNSYRIRFLEENATVRREWQKFTIDAIAVELGFSNRISFYNATKKHRGLTPSELLVKLGLG